MKPTAKPYATLFTFDPNEDRIYCRLSAMEQIIIAGIPDSLRNNERRRATAQLLADAPGALVKCLEALCGLVASVDRAKAAIPRQIDPGSRLDVLADTARAAILRAETVLGIEKGKP